MKFSSVTEQELLALPPKDKWEIICGKIRDDGRSADFALLLGSRPKFAKERALAAAALYHSGRVKYIVPSGGVKWELEDGRLLSEACYMAEVLIEAGVPEEAILIENEATTTKENMLYGAILINRKGKFKGDKGIIIVTSQIHMQRSLALAKAFLPRMVEISAYPSFPAETKEEQLESEEYRWYLDRGISLTKGLVENGIIEDFEIELP